MNNTFLLSPCGRLFRFLPLCFCAAFMATSAWASPADTLWSENFEGDWTRDWSVDAGTWDAGIPTSGSNKAFRGQKCAATVLAGNYAANVKSHLIRQTSFVVPPASESPRLRFWHWFSIGAYDTARVQIKRTTETQWRTVWDFYINTGSGVWTNPSLDLSSYAGATVQIAFYFASEGDGYVSSGWYVDEVSVISGSKTFNNPEAWDAGLSDWHVDKGFWEVGKAQYGPAFLPSSCAATVLGGNYHANGDARLISPTIIIPPAEKNPRLRFWHWYRLGAYDVGRVQIKVGNQPWQTISEEYINTSGEVWTHPSLNLSAFAGKKAQFAFYFTSAGDGYVSAGWYVDVVEIVTGSEVFNNPEKWNAGLGDWYVDKGTWEVGTKPRGIGPDTCFSPPNCAGTAMNGKNYQANTDTRLTSPYFIVPDAGKNPNLRFAHWYSFGAYDSGFVEIKIENGNWRRLLGPYINTSSNVWSVPFADLIPYAGKSAQLAFHFISVGDGYVSSGWFVDDIQINGMPLDFLAVNPTSLCFDNVPIGQSLTQTLTIFNSSSNLLRVNQINLTGTDAASFQTNTTSFQLAPRASLQRTVVFSPQRIGSFEARLEITGDAGAQIVPLFGNCVVTTGVANRSESVGSFMLYPNFPNPFNPSTTIAFDLPRASEVTLKIFDLVGHEVATLAQQKMQAGRYSFKWDANGLPGGVYFYRLQTEAFTQTRKLLLLR